MPSAPVRSVAIAAAVVLALSLPSVATAEAPGFEPAACPFILPPGQVDGESVDCGYLVVPEDRSDTESRTIRLATAIFHPSGAPTRPDPVVYLEGGPGGSPLRLVGTLRDFDTLFAPFVESGRDLILIDQRGVGYSQPALECPGFSEVYLDLFDQRLGDTGDRLSGEEMRALKVAALADCAEALSTEADLAAYNTAENAADVADLALALGYDDLNLWGTSYGTWVALDAMRDHPEVVRAVILDAPLTPEADPYVEAPTSFQRALDEVFAACTADTDCDEAYPDLAGVLAEAVARLDADPVLVDILDPPRGVRVPLLMDGPTFLEQVFRALYMAAMRPALPEIIYDAREGVFDTLLTLTQMDVMRQGFRSWGMYYSVLCHDEVPFSSIEAFEAARARYPGLAAMYDDFEIGPLPFEACADWGAGAADASEAEAIESHIPALITTGQYDPIVPPHWGDEAGQVLENASFFLFPGHAHGVSGDPCATEMMLAFLDEPDALVDASCMAEMPIAAFELPSKGVTPVELEAFTDAQFAIEGLRPSGWTEAGPGTFARVLSGTDPTSLVMVRLPVSAEETLVIVMERFGLTVAPDPTETRAAGDIEWARYTTTAQGVVIDFAIAPLGETSFVVVMTTAPDERDLLVERVMLPALDALRPS